MPDLEGIIARLRSRPGMLAKRELALVRRLPWAPDGDDAAVVDRDGEHLLVCGEAIAPDFVRSHPHAAGAAAAVTSVADIRAMGGRPLALVDMVVSPDREHAGRVLDGLAWAADLLGVEVAGGHLTIGSAPALSASCTGVARAVLRARQARPGDTLLAAFCLKGRYLGETPFFSSLRDRPPERLAGDGEVLSELAESGACRAARDVSMPGAVGSLLQMLEPARCGAVLQVEKVPRPAGVGLERWLATFPSFGFLLAAPPDRADEAVRVFGERGLACARCGSLDSSRVLRLRAGGREAPFWDLSAEPFTGLGGETGRSP